MDQDHPEPPEREHTDWVQDRDIDEREAIDWAKNLSPAERKLLDAAEREQAAYDERQRRARHHG